MGFTPEAESEVIRELVSHKLDRPLVNPSNRFFMDSTRTKSPTLPFQIGDSLRYTILLHDDMVDPVGVNTNDPDIIK